MLSIILIFFAKVNMLSVTFLKHVILWYYWTKGGINKVRIKKEWIGMFLLLVVLSILFIMNLDSDAVVIEIGEKVNDQTSDMIKVYISGEVVSPGVYDIASKERLETLVSLAGGFTEIANTTGVNLARKLRDGEMVVIYEMGSEIEYVGLDILNYGQLDEIKLITGIGEVLATRIIKYRESNGLFLTYDDLLNIEGIGQQKLDAIQSSVDD